MEQMHLGQDEADGDGDGERIMEPLELEEFGCLHDGHKVWSLSWSPCPCTGVEYMLAAGESNTIIWQCKDSKWSILKELPNKGKRYIQSCAWSLDGTLLAVGDLSNIAIWEYKESDEDLFKLIANIYGPRDHIIRSLSWNTNGLLLSCSNYGNICIIGKSKGTYDVECRVCECEISETSCAIWHPDDTTFAVAGHRKIKIYDTQILVDQDVKAYHIHTIEHRRGHKGGIEDISYSKNGDFMTSAGVSTKIWSITSNTTSRSSSISITSGRELVSDLLDHYEVRGEDPRGGFSRCDWSRCKNESIGYLIASACLFNDIYIFAQYHNNKGCLDSRVGATKLDAHNGDINDLKWHPKDAGLLASAGSDGIKIWKVKGQVMYSREPWIRSSWKSSSVRNGAPDPTSTKRMRMTRS